MKLFFAVLFTLSFFMIGCGGEKKENSSDKAKVNEFGLTEFEMVNGIGPFKEKVELKAINQDWVKEGEKLFKEKCTTCHDLDTINKGPAQRDVFKRRSPEFIMNMILNPAVMIAKHPEIQKLKKEYKDVEMTFMNTSKNDAYKLLDYFRKVIDEKPEVKK